jgi:hypothetical protein
MAFTTRFAKNVQLIQKVIGGTDTGGHAQRGRGGLKNLLFFFKVRYEAEEPADFGSNRRETGRIK